MTLYSKNGAEPQELPFSDHDSEGNLWADLANNPAGHAACGWVEAPDAPDYDPEAASLSWVGGAWVVTPFTPEELAARLEALRSSLISLLPELRQNAQMSVQITSTQFLATFDHCIDLYNQLQATADRTSLLAIDLYSGWPG
jgi:hypothetical protein